MMPESRGFRRARTTVVALLGAACLVALAACGGAGAPAVPGASAVPSADEGGGPEWQRVVDAARAEGKVVLYLSVTGVDDRLEQGFQAAYPGISLDIFRTGSGELLSRLDQEAATRSAGADVTVNADKAWFEKNLDRLVAPAGPAYDRYWKGARSVYADGRFALVDAAPLVIAYNSDVLDGVGAHPITSFADLLQPQLKGLIGYTPAQNATAALQYWFTATPALGGADGLRRFAAQQPKAYSSLTPLVQALAAGEHGVAVYASQATVDPLAAKGAPLETVVPDPQIGGGHFAGVVNWATHPNAAQVFRNWLLSPQGQAALTGPGDLLTPLPLSAVPNAPQTMASIPTSMFVTDGQVTSEQRAWMDDVWTPALGR
jgi:iron(III) transport system substrate-binding protein